MLRRLAIACVLSVSMPCCGQSKDTTPDSASMPRIIKHTQLVYVPVVVDDKKGHLVAGLSRGSFVVEQDGKEQKISLFEEVRSSTDFSSRSQPIAPGTIENFALSDTQARKSLIIIIDALNTPFIDQSRAKKSLVDFVAKSLQADQPVALMVLSNNGLHQIHSITADPKVLLDSVQRLHSHYNRGSKEPDPLGIAERNSLGAITPSTHGSEASGGPNPEAEAVAMMQYLDAVEANYFQRDAAITTLHALEQLAGSFAGIPGRKSVIWATSGFPFNIQDPHSFNGVDSELFKSYERTWKRLNDANLAIYPVDVSGLTISASAPITSRSRQNSGWTSTRDRALPQPFDLHTQQQSTLMSFASATGGKACLNSNDIQGCFATAASESDGYYLLGYYLQSGEDRPGWHKLKVHVKASHGEVRARDGFYVADSQNPEKERFKEITAALASPIDFTGVHFGIRVGEASAVSESGPRAQKLHVSMPPGSLLIDSDKNNNLINADFAVIAVANEKVVGQTLRSFHMNLTPADLQKVSRVGLGFDSSVEVPTGEYEVRVAVRDLNSDRVGTLRTHLIVP